MKTWLHSIVCVLFCLAVASCADDGEGGTTADTADVVGDTPVGDTPAPPEDTATDTPPPETSPADTRDDVPVPPSDTEDDTRPPSDTAPDTVITSLDDFEADLAVQADGLDGPIRIYRDGYGVPHVLL